LLVTFDGSTIQPKLLSDLIAIIYTVIVIALRFNVPLDTQWVISEMLFLAKPIYWLVLRKNDLHNQSVYK